MGPSVAQACCLKAASAFPPTDRQPPQQNLRHLGEGLVFSSFFTLERGAGCPCLHWSSIRGSVRLQTRAWYYVNMQVGDLSEIPWWPGPWDLGGGDPPVVGAGILVESSFVYVIVGFTQTRRNKRFLSEIKMAAGCEGTKKKSGGLQEARWRRVSIRKGSQPSL